MKGPLALLGLVALGGVADARPASTGWNAEAGFGATIFLPDSGNYIEPGPNVEIRLGRDLFSWFSLGIVVAASSHEAAVPPPPEDEWFQLYRGGADARIGGRLDRLALFLEGGVGVALFSSNVLDKVGITEPGDTFALAFHAGAGLEYQLENRHYALGLAGDAILIPQFDAARGVGSRVYLRYTY